MNLPRLVTKADLERYLAMDLPLRERTCEGDHLDFKGTYSKSLAHAVVAFSNTAGGVVLIGVEEAEVGKGVGGLPNKVVGVATPHEARLEIVDRLGGAVEPFPRVDVNAIDVGEGRSVIVVKVAPGPECPYFYKEGPTNRVLVRVGPQCVDAPRGAVLGLCARREVAGVAKRDLIPNGLQVFCPKPPITPGIEVVPYRVRFGLSRAPQEFNGVLNAQDEVAFREHVVQHAPLLSGPALHELSESANYSFTADTTALVPYPRWWIEGDGSVFAGHRLNREQGETNWSGPDVLRASAMIARVAASWLRPKLATFEPTFMTLMLEPQHLAFTKQSHVGGATLPLESYDARPPGARYTVLGIGPPGLSPIEHMPVDIERDDLDEALAVLWLRSLRRLHAVSANLKDVKAFLKAESKA